MLFRSRQLDSQQQDKYQEQQQQQQQQQRDRQLTAEPGRCHTCNDFDLDAFNEIRDTFDEMNLTWLQSRAHEPCFESSRRDRMLKEPGVSAFTESTQFGRSAKF